MCRLDVEEPGKPNGSGEASMQEDPQASPTWGNLTKGAKLRACHVLTLEVSELLGHTGEAYLEETKIEARQVSSDITSSNIWSVERLHRRMWSSSAKTLESLDKFASANTADAPANTKQVWVPFFWGRTGVGFAERVRG